MNQYKNVRIMNAGENLIQAQTRISNRSRKITIGLALILIAVNAPRAISLLTGDNSGLLVFEIFVGIVALLGAFMYLFYFRPIRRSAIKTSDALWQAVVYDQTSSGGVGKLTVTDLGITLSKIRMVIVPALTPQFIAAGDLQTIIIGRQNKRFPSGSYQVVSFVSKDGPTLTVASTDLPSLLSIFSHNN